MKFTVKKSLIGIAALSLLAPVASHADTTTGPMIKDGFNNRTKDGRGSTCVATGGASQASGSGCMSEADAMNAKAEAAAAARKAAKAESDAAAKAAAQAARDEALMANVPGSGLAPGQKGAYVGQGTNGMIRDGYGRSCVKDGLWNPTMSSEECDPDLYGLYRSKQTQTAQSDLAPRQAAVPPEAVQPQSELAPRLPYTAQEAVRPIYFAPFVAPLGADDEEEADAINSEALAEDEEVTPDMIMSDADRALPADDAEIGLLAATAVVAAGEDDDEEEAAAQDEFMEDEETTPDMMMSDADRALSDDGEPGLLAAAAVDDDDDDDETDDGLPGDDDEDQDTTPDMMMSEEDRRLPEDGVVLLAMVPTDDDDDDDGNLDEDLEDEETTPDMMMSDADRILAGDDDKSPGVAALEDTSPGVAPAPEKKVESKPVVDNKLPDFPVTKYELAQAQSQAPAQASKPLPAAASLPVTINVQDGLFDFDRAELKSDFISKLDSVADMLRESKVDAVSIVGHADPIGSAEYNQALSLRRAESAKRYLVGKGIDAKRISTSGVGEQDLVVTRAGCASERKEALIDCLQPNRRVVVDVAGAMAAK